MVRLAIGVILFGLVLAAATQARADNISGTISATKTIFINSQLVKDVTCTVSGAPCIQFGSNGIKLQLNGHVMTGQSNSTTGCDGSLPTFGEDGILSNSRSNVAIQGPGLIRRFRGAGIFVVGGTGVTVTAVTLSTNCGNGMTFAADSGFVVNNQAARNASGNNFVRGGIDISGDNNYVQSNLTGGNGITGNLNDFGLAVGGNGNFLTRNESTGNTQHGLLVFSSASGNTFSKNVFIGNPSIQSSISGFNGVDVFNDSGSGANTFTNNLCETSSGPDIRCPNLPSP